MCKQLSIPGKEITIKTILWILADIAYLLQFDNVFEMKLEMELA